MPEQPPYFTRLAAAYVRGALADAPARQAHDVPTLVLHGEDDQIVPVKDSAKKSARLIKGAREIYYPGAPHGITATHQDQVNAELLNFLKEERKARVP